MTLTVGSLFSGIGGLELGLERAGMKTMWQVECDEYATKVLQRHWPDVKRWGDVWDFIRDADGRNEAQIKARHQQMRESNGNRSRHAVDVVCGGFPCQPFSMAGKRRGMADDRWLWPAFRRVVELVGPRYVVIENVPGLLSAADSVGRRGGIFGSILADLASLGFDAEWQVLPAAAFGAPHLRNRVFVVAYARHGNIGRGTQQGSQRNGDFEIYGKGRTVADADQSRPQERNGERGDACTQQSPAVGTDWRTIEPCIRRGDARLPSRVDRLRCLGNAVVPQVAEFVGRAIMTWELLFGEDRHD